MAAESLSGQCNLHTILF